ncbi:DUF262 domain-containing protein [Mariniflexile gromovii]|uniref:DUF262 domain-containing protein n=1 Tax=Mariniflexile gromovii TaxID=362523 RepID=A0ABS4BYB9_9FLAO|nr:DUF262 domain-containing protein [Mariniflexile gromovii]MBP0905586.1 DUF262 domain-containing protein [Mariniflexile gromovii]
MEENKYTGEIFNFHKLLNKYQIEIPIIQRDYAQGRKDKKEIRENFLNALFNSVKNSEPIKLDFIYGSVVNNHFQPLDGQQRLTTLFLLHWYAATKENKLLQDDVRIKLKRFSYETRISSREFCYDLVNKSIFISSQEDSISRKIIDSNWFFLSWKNDPTIDGMLRTIDSIHKVFFQVEDLWLKLTSNLIEFYFVELENMGLTDDLYIKMNARGKLLTSFENFKAGFQKRIQDEGWEVKTNLENTFGVKIDNDWTDFFWDHFRTNNSVDNALIRFIATIAMIMQSVERSQSTELRLELINTLQEEPSLVRPINFSKQGFDQLVKYFNIYNEYVILHNYEFMSFPFPMWRHTSKGSILSMNVLEDNTYSALQRQSSTYTQKVLFFAQAQYFIKNNFNEEKYYDWMRVIRNIISRGDIEKDGSRPDIIRSPAAFDGVINLINELSEGSNDIYYYLANSTGFKSQFSREQIYEEVEKARLIQYNHNYKNIIFQAEDNDLLRGKISFIFYCINYNYSLINFDEDLFVNITEVINRYFSKESDLNNKIRRAIMTIEVEGKFDFYTYWWSYWHVGNATKRRLFDKFRELEYFINHEFYRKYFKKLVLELIHTTPDKIIENFTPNSSFPNWKKKLIKDSSILDNLASTNLIAIPEDESCCYLLKSSRPREIEGNIKIE